MRRFNFNLKHMLVCMAALLSPQFQLAGVYPLVPALLDRKSTRLNSSHPSSSRMPSSA